MARRKQPVIPDAVLDQLLAGADPKTAFAEDGLLDRLKKALAERALNAEMDQHLAAGAGNPCAKPHRIAVSARGSGWGANARPSQTANAALRFHLDHFVGADHLAIVRKSLNHPGTKGDASENVWNNMLNTYLPKRYQAAKAHVVDSEGKFSQQIDVVVFDRQYSPFIFTYEEQTIIPAESVYAVFEAKQTADAALVAYAQEKVASVRRLLRTSLPIPHAGGVYPAKAPIPILGGLLTFESKWSPALGPSLEKALHANAGEGRLDIGCIASHGHFFSHVSALHTYRRMRSSASNANQRLP
jgi:hypothetical protein